LCIGDDWQIKVGGMVIPSNSEIEFSDGHEVVFSSPAYLRLSESDESVDDTAEGSNATSPAMEAVAAAGILTADTEAALAEQLASTPSIRIIVRSKSIVLLNDGKPTLHDKLPTPSKLKTALHVMDVFPLLGTSIIVWKKKIEDENSETPTP